jgi:hypothetical protein
MPSCAQHSSRPPVPPPPPPAPPSSPSIFSPDFLARLHDRDESPTASEADLAGPWHTEPVPGRPGSSAVLRVWESLAAGDRLRAELDQEELAQLCAVALPLLGREPLFHLARSPDRAATRSWPSTPSGGRSSTAPSHSTSPSWRAPSTCSRASPARRPPSPG